MKFDSRTQTPDDCKLANETLNKSCMDEKWNEFCLSNTQMKETDDVLMYDTQ